MTTTAPHNRIALVTGAGSGIGQGCAALLDAPLDPDFFLAGLE